MLNNVGSIDDTIIKRIVHGFPAVASAIEDAPPEKWPLALEAAEASYIDALRLSGISDAASHSLAGSVIRRLKGRLAGDDLSDDEILDKIRLEQGLIEGRPVFGVEPDDRPDGDKDPGD
jgi:hypothetical protein